MGRVIALDVGDVRIGVAVTDPTGTIAQPLEVYKRVGYGPDCRYVQELCRRFDTVTVLLGLPLNMDGTRGGQAEKAQAFGKVLSDAGLDVRYQDERMTTVTAERVLNLPGTAWSPIPANSTFPIFIRSWTSWPRR